MTDRKSLSLALPKKLTDDKRQDFDPETVIDIPSNIGTGTYRTTGTWIAVMLMTEDVHFRYQIINSVMDTLGMSIEKLTDYRDDTARSKCGISLMEHQENNGECF